MRFVVGGQEHDLTREQVIEAMRGVEPEPARTHLVELPDAVYPPKQVFATVTGRDRQTFTTMEAQRVLTRLRLVGRRARDDEIGRPPPARQEDDSQAEGSAPDDRLAVVEAQLATAITAIAGLSARMAVLEGRTHR